MKAIESYIAAHISAGEYRGRLAESIVPGYESVYGWTDFVINSRLIFSFRNTRYTKSSFREKLHAHDFYELVIFASGEVRYVCENKELSSPKPGDMIITAPGRLHTGVLKCESDYARYVIYFSADALGESAKGLLEFLAAEPFLRLKCGSERIFKLLDELREICASSLPLSEFTAYGRLIQLFCLIADSGESSLEINRLPTKALEIKSYIDAHIRDITGIGELAEHFFYSREYLSRYFSRTFNISIGQYITGRRIELSKRLLAEGRSVTDTAYECGFENASFFIRVFKDRVGLTPHKYAKSLRERGG